MLDRWEGCQIQMNEKRMQQDMQFIYVQILNVMMIIYP